MNKVNLDNLQINTEQRLEQLIFEVDQIFNASIKIDNAKKIFKKIDINLSVLGFENLLKYRLFLGIVSMDLCSAILIHTKSKSNYENLFSARQIIVIINEAYKKIYNFLSENEYGDIVEKYRNNSYWIKEIGYIIKNELPELQSEYDIITLSLDDYLKINFEELRNQRNLSVHYDKEPTRVYKMLLDLDVDKTYQLLIPFMAIINKMYEFTDKLRKGFKIKSDIQSKEINANLEGMINNLEKFKTLGLNDEIFEIQNILREIKDS